MKALESLTAATPANANIFAELGEMRFARREFQQAALEYRAAARLDPDEPQTWNELGYALAWAKDLSGAREALAQYQKLAPGDANVLDSEGEVSYLLGDFKSAGEYFEKAAAKNPAELVKAAEARLMMGDRQGADALFAKHLGPGEGAEQWRGLSDGAMGVSDRPAESRHGVEWKSWRRTLNGDLQSLAFSQLAIWKLESGDKKAAADLANQAVTRAQSAAGAGMSAAAAVHRGGDSGELRFEDG